MDKELEEIFNMMGIDGTGCYIDQDGYVREINSLSGEDDYTGIYQDKDGYFRKINSLCSEDDYTGIYQDKDGHFRKINSLCSEDEYTGIYQDKDGYFREKTSIDPVLDDYLIHSKDENKNQSFSSYSNPSYSRSSSYSSSSSSFSDFNFTDGCILFLFLLAIIIAILIKLAYFSLYLLYFSPLIILLWYLKKKREQSYIAIIGILWTVYLIYDIYDDNYFGFIHMFPNYYYYMTNLAKETNLSIGYFSILVALLGCYIDKYTSKNPVIEYGNIFQRQDITGRRIFLSTVGVCSIIGFLVFNVLTGKYEKEPDTKTVNVSNTVDGNPIEQEVLDEDYEEEYISGNSIEQDAPIEQVYVGRNSIEQKAVDEDREEEYIIRNPIEQEALDEDYPEEEYINEDYEEEHINEDYPEEEYIGGDDTEKDEILLKKNFMVNNKSYFFV